MPNSSSMPSSGFKLQDLPKNMQLATVDDKTNTPLVQTIAKPEADKLQNVSMVHVFPNPIDDKQSLTIALDKGFSIAQTQLFDMSGRLIQADISYNDSTATIHTHGLENGIYLLYLKDMQANVHFKQIIKQ
ncbi:MAG: T9SS type A sorting domain-containing protein [Sphingobacteriales bacterium]|nr:T9SS type A sorting domain-containing protein [Sphingobacteriales bacterium]